jgi:signal transduction histidine kinase
MWEFVQRIVAVGQQFENSPGRKSAVRLSNTMTLLTAATFLLLIPFVHFYFNHILADLCMLLGFFNFLIPWIFNYWGWSNFSRIYYCVTLPAIFILGSMAKLSFLGFDTAAFWYVYRLPVIATAIMPFTLFMHREREKWVPIVLLNIHVILLHNQIILWALDIEKPEPSALEYSAYFDLIALMSYVVLGLMAYLVRGFFESYAREKKHFIQKIQDSSEALTIQKNQLTQENADLIHELQDKHHSLKQTHSDLLQRQSDLLQFSYSVSHNLRGPVAGMIGLNNLIDPDGLSEENRELFEHIKQLCSNLEETINDLNLIISLQNRADTPKQPVSLHSETDKIAALLHEQIKNAEVEISRDLKVDLLFSFKPAIHSILYNLLNNAIKYRKPGALCQIEVNSYVERGRPVFCIKDNGIGFDSAAIGDNLFGLYKRFHFETEGKGMGLFLVKMQVEMIGGNIIVESKPGQGAMFAIELPPSALLNGNCVFSSSVVSAYRLTDINSYLCSVKSNFNIDQFADIFKAFKEAFDQEPMDIVILEYQKERIGDENLHEIRRLFAQRINKLEFKYFLMVFPKDIRADFDVDQFIRETQDIYQMEVRLFESLGDCITFARQISAHSAKSIR